MNEISEVRTRTDGQTDSTVFVAFTEAMKDACLFQLA
jgi:hypothetical protein